MVTVEGLINKMCVQFTKLGKRKQKLHIENKKYSIQYIFNLSTKETFSTILLY